MILKAIVAVVMICALLWYTFYVVIPEFRKVKPPTKQPEKDPGDLDSLLTESAKLAQKKKQVRSQIKNHKKALDEATKHVEN